MREQYFVKVCCSIVLLGLLTILSGCGGGNISSAASSENTVGQVTTTTSNGTVLLSSSKVRDTTPATENVTPLVSGNTAFALDFYRSLANENGKQGNNRFFSPYSISLCFAMAYGGARGNTETQMKDVLHYTLGQDQLHSAFNALSLDLASREQDLDDDGEKDFQLNIANAMWGQNGYTFLNSYLDLLSENYGAGLRLLDLQHQPDLSAQIINAWASEETQGKINEVVFPWDFDENSLFVLANAVYFKAKWMHEFNELSTHDATFYANTGNVTVPMMHQWCYVNYGEGENYQAAGIPYMGNTSEMLVLLPREGKFAEFEASLTVERLAQIVENLESKEVILKLPKFEYRPDTLDLKEVLSQMGMTDAFMSGNADFSGMDGVPYFIYLAFARHKAFVSVDEKGTEAAAVTVIGGGDSGYPVTPDTEFNANRPFIFLIRDRVTGTILFMGRILDPSKTTDG
jgi:serpin B